MSLDLTPQDYVAAAYADAMIEGLCPKIVAAAYHQSKDAEEFFFRVQALVQLNDIVKDHYDNRPPSGRAKNGAGR